MKEKTDRGLRKFAGWKCGRKGGIGSILGERWRCGSAEKGA